MKKYRIKAVTVVRYTLHYLQERRSIFFFPYWKNIDERRPLESVEDFLLRVQKITNQDSIVMRSESLFG
jgi:hypothetical protein